ncbi:MAG TPA: AAA family ATPase [Solirubrobacteraceae bacterium]|nr:AAA family ATPase [Solirubrobacteraceae bacterium]
MYLKSITLKGFKSFPDRTRLEFGPGTSVIVGPNGSGKSNVTDAVLWALGEQSPMAVRGQSMQDVIFGGAPGRQAAHGASVELVLDDSEQILGLGPEVSILRRLDRNGEGEYRLAGARCRLIDVIELLSDTGMGKEMHSVISQGRVEAIVTSKPRDRRLLIEEAAGLGKHRKRRRRAQLKLGHTQENLDRALDVEREARSRLRPLKRQAEAAELHARLRRQTLEIRWELAREELRARLAEVAGSREQAAQARAARQELESELEQVATRRRAAEEALAERSSQREQLSRRSFATQSAYERVGYRTDSIRSAAGTVHERLKRGEAALETLRSQEAADQPDDGAAKQVVALEREMEALERDREAELARQLTELENRLRSAEQAEAGCVSEVERAETERARAEAGHEQARQALRQAEREVETARRQSARVGGELAAANQFLRSHQTAPGGARSLADALSVASGYELAVAAALDGRLGAALAEDRPAAAEVLERAGRDGGRVLLASLPEAGEQALGPPPLPGAERLADRVAGEDGAARLARRLLHDAWVVEDLQSLPDEFAGTATTRQGRVFSPALRELRQAASVGDERILAERNRRDELVAASEKAVQAEYGARQAVERLAQESAAWEADREAAVAAHRSAVRRRDEATEEQRRLTASIDRRRSAPDEGPGAARRAQLHAELDGLRSRLERTERERAGRAAQIERLQAATRRDAEFAPAITEVIGELEQMADAIAARRSEFEAALAAHREAGEHVAAELRSCAQHEAGLQNRLHTASESLTSLEVRAQRAADQAEDAAEALNRLAAELQLEAVPASEPLDPDVRGDLEIRLERLARRREQLGPVNPLAEQEYSEAIAHVEELERQRADLDTALRELEKLIKDTDRQIKETFEETFAAAARNFEELAAQLFPGGRGRLRLVSERERRAPVLGGLKDVTTSQNGDRPAAECSDAEEPEEQEDEDVAGVEIEITPAGKATRQLTLLSGGEKSMTALAFLFAVFLARPCPFYILDEVEAALDDLNIDRFLSLLDTYSSRAQFIVVTHQKRTMEAADVLYGVSMGGDGISKVISRRLPAREAA